MNRSVPGEYTGRNDPNRTNKTLFSNEKMNCSRSLVIALKNATENASSMPIHIEQRRERKTKTWPSQTKTLEPTLYDYYIFEVYDLEIFIQNEIQYVIVAFHRHAGVFFFQISSLSFKTRGSHRARIRKICFSSVELRKSPLDERHIRSHNVDNNARVSRIRNRKSVIKRGKILRVLKNVFFLFFQLPRTRSIICTKYYLSYFADVVIKRKKLFKVVVNARQSLGSTLNRTHGRGKITIFRRFVLEMIVIIIFLQRRPELIP